MDRSAMVPTEDTIKALVDHLVSPVLSFSESFRESLSEAPSDRQQMMVAKQMHAVAILYNYYHRKQFPELEVLCFESFCKICCIAKSGLLIYMTYMIRCKDSSENLNNQLSVTEKMVMDACNICRGLDPSKDNPILDRWPISKIAVFLVNSAKERCLLWFCSITHGVWSLMEKVLETSLANCSSQSESYQYEEILEKLAFSSVEQETGIASSELSILERHLTYSLSHEKTSTRLYIMKYERALNEEFTEFAIKDLIRSLKGPLVKKDVTCEVTPAVEYYAILPYIDIISSWASRENAHCDSFDIHVQTVDERKCCVELGETSSIEDHETVVKFASNESNVQTLDGKLRKGKAIQMNRDDQPFVHGSSAAAKKPENRASSPCMEPKGLNIMNDQPMDDELMQNRQDDNVLNNKKNKLKDPITYNRRVGGLSRVANSCNAGDRKHQMVLDTIPATKDCVISIKPGSSGHVVNIKINKMVETEAKTKESINYFPENNGSFSAIIEPYNVVDVSQVDLNGLFTVKGKETKDTDKLLQNGTEDTIVIRKNTKDAITSGKESGDSYTKDSNASKGDASPRNHHQQPSHSDDTSGTNIVSDANGDKGKGPIYNAMHVSVGGFEDQAYIVDSVKCPAKCTSEDRTSSSGARQDGRTCGSLPIMAIDGHHTFYDVMASKQNDLLQLSLRVFQKKREELCQQKRLLEDDIARCEMNIQRILRGGEESAALQVDLITEALNSFFSSPGQICMNLSSEEPSPSQNTKKRKLLEAVLSSANPCQELDDICHMNSWVLPRYIVYPTLGDFEIAGMFKATVTVNGTDFECRSTGDPKSSPREARESAACHVLSTLRKLQEEQ